ncbi:hypothetical protein TNCV_168531 [Trichonephila clavipes]|nr:hypothetical protein TNCV_168531 [Trichonephila clavipes]
MRQTYTEEYSQCQSDMSIRLIGFPYGLRGTAALLISVMTDFCLKEPMELGTRQRMPGADTLKACHSETTEGVKEEAQGV